VPRFGGGKSPPPPFLSACRFRFVCISFYKVRGHDARETLARAYACAGDPDRALENYSNAEAVGKAIENEEDAKMFLDDLKNSHWFGIR
jgi:hypothetical protein